MLERQRARSATNVTFDTMIAAYLLNEKSVGLKDLSFSRLGIEMTEISELIGTGRSQITMDLVEVPISERLRVCRRGIDLRACVITSSRS